MHHIQKCKLQRKEKGRKRVTEPTEKRFDVKKHRPLTSFHCSLELALQQRRRKNNDKENKCKMSNKWPMIWADTATGCSFIFAPTYSTFIIRTEWGKCNPCKARQIDYTVHQKANCIFRIVPATSTGEETYKSLILPHSNEPVTVNVTLHQLNRSTATCTYTTEGSPKPQPPRVTVKVAYSQSSNVKKNWMKIKWRWNLYSII